MNLCDKRLRRVGMLFVFLSLASADAQMMYRVEPYRPLAREYGKEDSDAWRVNELTHWIAVEPCWAICCLTEYAATDIRTGPLLPPIKRVVGVIAVNTESGRVKWVHRFDRSTSIQSLVALGPNRCGVVYDHSSDPAHIPAPLQESDSRNFSCNGSVSAAKDENVETRLLEWDLRCDRVFRHGGWASVNPIARHLDFSTVCLSWENPKPKDLSRSGVKIRHRLTGSTVEVPMPPDQDHSRWSFDATTDERGIVRWAVRWYAPIESGTGVVVFDGHQKAISEFEFGFEDDAIFTCFDLDAANGIRWQLPISRVIDIKSHRVEKIRPVFSTYQRSDHLIMLVETGVHYRGFRELNEERILIKKIRLSDGRCETLANTSNGMLIDYIRWSSANSPQTSSQGGSLMFINQSVDLNVPIGVNASRLVTVFPHHSGEPEVVALRLQNLTTSSDLIGILPDGQVIVGNESSLSSCSRQSDGQMSVRLICRLLIPDAEP